MTERDRKPCYFVVFDWMLTELKLSGYQAFIYAAIHNYSQDPNGCFSGSISYLQKALGASRQAVINALAELVKKELIAKNETVINGVKFNTYRSTGTGSQETRPPVQKVVKGSQETGLGGSQETRPNNKEEIINNNKDIPPLYSPQQEYSDDFEFAYSQYPHCRNSSKKKAYRAWMARIKEGITPEALTDGVIRYARYVRLSNTSEQFVKHPSTFFGPDGHYALDWSPPERSQNDASDWINELNRTRYDYHTIDMAN